MASIPIQRTQAWRHLSTEDKVELMVSEFDEFETRLEKLFGKLDALLRRQNQLFFAVVAGLFLILAAIIGTGIHG